jgi:hypothetical protein
MRSQACEKPQICRSTLLFSTASDLHLMWRTALSLAYVLDLCNPRVRNADMAVRHVRRCCRCCRSYGYRRPTHQAYCSYAV